MPSDVQYKVVRVFNKGSMTARGLSLSTVEQLGEIISRDEWCFFDQEAENLIAFLVSIEQEVLQAHQSQSTTSNPPTQSQQSQGLNLASPSFALSDLSPLSLQTPTPKRGRGRPRGAYKRIQHPLAIESTTNDGENRVPARGGRPRGRPRTRTQGQSRADVTKGGR